MLENTNTKQFYPGPILNRTLEITKFLFRNPEQVRLQKTALDEYGKAYDIELTYGTDYEVQKVLPNDINIEDANLTASTGQITLKSTVEVNEGEKLTAYRESALVQDTDYPRTGKFPAASHEGALDYLTMQNQEQQEQINRSLKIPVSIQNFNAQMPIPLPAKALKINATGDGFEMSEYDPDIALDITNEHAQNAQNAANAALASQSAAASSSQSAMEQATIAKEQATIATTQAGIATTQAGIATTQAGIATAKTNEVVESGNTAITAITAQETTSKNNIEAKGAEQIELIQNEGATQIANVQSTGETEYNKIITTGIDYKASIDLDNLTPAGEKHFLNKTQITNCLLEVPQRIKLEFNDGTLTLKAGSKVIVPNGFETDGVTPKFDEVEIESDVVAPSQAWSTSKDMFAYGLDKYVHRRSLTLCYSGPTRPSAEWCFWYDTANNKCWSIRPDGDILISLPVSIVNANSSQVYTSINQVFNGMGYIGSTVWVDKGVKGLIPKGRNDDGTLRNIEFVTDKLKTVTNASGLSQPLWYTVNGSFELYSSTTDFWIYDNEENLYKHGNNYAHFVVIAQSNTTNGVISNFNPKQPFRAVDYSDKAEVSGWGMPSNKYIDLTLGASGSIYSAPANGYFLVAGNGGSTNAYVDMRNTTAGLLGVLSYSTNPNIGLRSFVPASKDDVISISYSNNFGSNGKSFRFVYAQGDK